MARPNPTRGRLRPRPASAGFTLVELMVSLVLLAVGLLAVGQLLIFSQQHAYHGRSETTAVSLAGEIREKILSENFGDLPAIFDGVDTSVPGTVPTTCQPWADHLAAELGPSGIGRLQVYGPGEDPEITSGMYSVAIEVAWEQSGKTKAVNLRFATSRMGL
ncbi:MAG: prepilin-type N-terminal cleavage/methylation domain-containing protein [Candidatus Eisenbacteria sp.]|nr:prepilin-type N-terminal cleavage/methylation domain-containing protein [Candidatus Eisenbacteria bacterium]